MSAGLRLLLVLLCFFLSGLTALIYQTAWTREFAFVFGTSELAVATVLAAYMGGLAAGSALAARFAAAVRRPILVYGLLELGIAGTALLVPFALRAATVIYGVLFAGRIDAGGLGSALFYVVASFAVLVVPTAFMGATLPLLARHAVRSDGELGPRIGLLYSVNTIGAVCGTVVAAFVLLPRIGLGATVAVAVTTNALIFVLAAAVARGAPDAPTASAADSSVAGTWSGRWILPLILASGVASFTYEVLWTRLLGQVLGGSVYAFATMLASFLVGIAGGAALAARWSTTPRAGAIGFAVAQIGTAVLALVAFAFADSLPVVAEAVRDLRPWGDALLSGLFLLPATLCIGATFPFAVRVLARGEADAGPASARVYAWNTVGAIGGALGAGFFGIPALGFAGTFQAAALLNLILAVAAGWWAVPPARGLSLAAAVVACAVLVVAPGTPWNVLRSGPLASRAGTGEIAYFGVGRSATVLVLEAQGQWRLRTNGLPEAAIRPPGHPPTNPRTARWLSALPMLARPEATSMLVIGLGGGIAVETLAPGLERIDVVELEPEVVRANRSLSDERARDPLADPRVRVVENDARGALNLTDEHYDLIVSQPSHPWTAGASHLYTREFFALVKDRLSPDGAMLQWIGPAFVDDTLLRILVGTLGDVFEHVVVHQSNKSGGILLLGSSAPLDPIAGTARAVRAAPEVFGQLGVATAEDVAATQLLDAAGARAYADGAPINRDRRNYLQMLSPKLRRSGVKPLDPSVPIAEGGLFPAAPDALDSLALVRRLLVLRFVERAEAVARGLADPVDRAVADALVEEGRGKPGRARTSLRRVLERAPAHPWAREALLRMRPPTTEVSEYLPAAGAGPAELAVRAALREAVTGGGVDPELDARLAAVRPGEPFYLQAVRLRAWGRIRAGGVEPLRGALALVDVSIARERRAVDLLARARIGAALENPVVTLASLSAWTAASPRGRVSRADLAEAQRLLGTVPEGGRWEAWRSSLSEQFRPNPSDPRGESTS